MKMLTLDFHDQVYICTKQANFREYRLSIENVYNECTVKNFFYILRNPALHYSGIKKCTMYTNFETKCQAWECTISLPSSSYYYLLYFLYNVHNLNLYIGIQRFFMNVQSMYKVCMKIFSYICLQPRQYLIGSGIKGGSKNDE